MRSELDNAVETLDTAYYCLSDALRNCKYEMERLRDERVTILGRAMQVQTAILNLSIALEESK